jgi:hypothetical protein
MERGRTLNILSMEWVVGQKVAREEAREEGQLFQENFIEFVAKMADSVHLSDHTLGADQVGYKGTQPD